MIGCSGWTGYCLGRNGHNSLGWYTRGPYPYPPNSSGCPPLTDKYLQWLSIRNYRYYTIQGVPKLSYHFVFFVHLLASINPYCKSWGSFEANKLTKTKWNSILNCGSVCMLVVILPQFLAPDIAPSYRILPVTFFISVLSVYVTQKLPILRGLYQL